MITRICAVAFVAFGLRLAAGWHSATATQGTRAPYQRVDPVADEYVFDAGP